MSDRFAGHIQDRAEFAAELDAHIRGRGEFKLRQKRIDVVASPSIFRIGEDFIAKITSANRKSIRRQSSEQIRIEKAKRALVVAMAVRDRFAFIVAAAH